MQSEKDFDEAIEMPSVSSLGPDPAEQPKADTPHADQCSGATYRPDDVSMRLAAVFIKCPHCCYCAALSFLLLLTAISVMSGAMTLNDQSEWTVHDAQATATLDAYLTAVEEHNPREVDHDRRLTVASLRRTSQNLSSPQVLDQRVDDGEGFVLIYKGEGGGDIMTPARIADICKFERIIVQSQYYRERCTRQWIKTMGTCANSASDSRCVKEGSYIWQSECLAYTPLQIFYGDLTVYDWSCSVLSASTVEQGKRHMIEDVQATGAKSRYASFLGRTTSEQGFSNVLKSSIMVRRCDKDRKDCAAEESFLEMENDLFKAFDPPRKYGFDIAPHFGFYSAYEFDADQFTNFGSVRVRYWVPFVNEGDRVVMQDFSLAFGSIVFVWMWMWIHLGCPCSSYPGFLLACFSMLQIICSLPVAALFYRHVFMVDYFEYVHILVVYLVLGIGADDLFVLVDTWKKSAEIFPPDDGNGGYINEATLVKRLAHTLRLTASAIFNTSFTTCTAFMSCSISKVMPMRTCGWYAALCIVTNYLLVLLLTPSVVVIGHLHFEGKAPPTGCCPPRCKVRRGCSVKLKQVMDSSCPVARGTYESRKESCIEVLLQRYYIPLMSKTVWSMSWCKPFPLFCICGLLAIGLQGLMYAVQLKPPTEPEKWFPSTHVLNGLGKYLTDEFLSADEDNYVRMNLFWGIEGLDREGFDVYNPDKFRGKAKYADDFDVSTAACQKEILDTCIQFRQLQCVLEGCANDGLGTLVRPGESGCFMEDFEAWLQAPPQNYGKEMLPLTGPQFLEQLRRFQKSFKVPSALEKVADYRQMIGIPRGSRCDASGHCPGPPEQPRFVGVAFRTTMPQSTRISIGTPVQDLVDDFVKSRRSGACGSSLKVHAYRKFASFDLGKELISGLFSGCAIAGPVAFVVLLVSTKNIMISFYATTSIAMIVATVLGFCKQPMGWGLGIGESIAGVIVIGYSVDYVVHLAHMYEEARHHGLQTREEKAAWAIRNMGSTVFAGAITTAGAGSIMFLCFIFFFTKMAVLICITIVFSFVFSLGFFMSLLFVVGPQGACGDIPIKACCSKA